MNVDHGRGLPVDVDGLRHHTLVNLHLQSSTPAQPLPPFHPPPPVSLFSAAVLPRPHHLSHRRSSISMAHLNRPSRRPRGPSRNSSEAVQALNRALCLPPAAISDDGEDNDPSFDSLLIDFAPRLRGLDDYSFLLTELGRSGNVRRAVRCFHFAVDQAASSPIHRSKLASSAISTFGRLGRADIARSLFDTAVAAGYGRNVYAYSALITAYARNGRAGDAIRVFNDMKAAGLEPNLVTYNAVIDACGKGGVDYGQTLSFFDEMVGSGVSPDGVTYNTLLAVCSRGGLWEVAGDLFNKMKTDRVERDMVTYNTFLDVVCKAGKMDIAMKIMSEISEQGLSPNIITYSTYIDGLAKAGQFQQALQLLEKMKVANVEFDRVLYNTLISIYSKLGMFDQAFRVCQEMESENFGKDVVTYNALINGYGKKGNYEAVKELLVKMKADGCAPNVVTYSTIFDSYAKMGMLKEAIKVLDEFWKQGGLQADVVLYGALINAFCKSGMSVDYLLYEMTMVDVKPNVFIFNSIIDAIAGGLYETDLNAEFGEDKSKDVVKGGNDKIAMDILSIFQNMQVLEIKPNVATFSSIVKACSHFNSFEDASVLLENLRQFDGVYHVAHGLLMGCGEKMWHQAQSLFDQVKSMDVKTALAFYNGLTDVLWHYGQRRDAQIVVLEGKRRQAWENIQCDKSCLDLHLMSLGAAQAMVHSWLLAIHAAVFSGQRLPELVSIITGRGSHSKVVGESVLRGAVEALLEGIRAPFRADKYNMGRLKIAGGVVDAWLKESGTLKLLILQNDRTATDGFDPYPELVMAPLS